MIHVEHSNNGNNHQFLNHYSATSETNLSDLHNSKFPTVGYEIHNSSRRQTPSGAHESAHSQLVASHYDYGIIFLEKLKLLKYCKSL